MALARLLPATTILASQRQSSQTTDIVLQYGRPGYARSKVSQKVNLPPGKYHRKVNLTFRDTLTRRYSALAQPGKEAKMLCQKCTYSNPDENNFCGNCGAPLPPTGRITLKDLLSAGLLKAGDELTIRLRSQEVTATLLSDGRIMYQNQTYDGPLACATAVRGQTCDGWYCWQAIDHSRDRSYPIAHYRGALLRQRGERP